MLRRPKGKPQSAGRENTKMLGSLTMETLLAEVRSCSRCPDLPLGPAPLLQASTTAKILIAGQAPGRITHQKGIPFDDPSGDRLRSWLGVSREQFYDPQNFAIIPMAFCFPGAGKTGDLPPPPLCAQTWRAKLLAELSQIRLTVILGRYAIDWHVPDLSGKSVTDAVEATQAGPNGLFVLPHPSPRNNRWLVRNPWFKGNVLPCLQSQVASLME